MSDESKSGTDLDIFEGLGKKNVKNGAGSAAPPPPPSMPPALGGKVEKKTLLGLAMPPPPPPIPGSAAPPPIPSGPPPAPPSGSFKAVGQTGPLTRPTPPPGHKGLPAVSGPPVKTTSSPPAAAAPPPPPPAAAASKPEKAAKSKRSGGIDMDWDDEDEATHVFDKDRREDEDVENALAELGERPGVPNSFPKSGASTLVGMSGQLPPPPPPLRSSPPTLGGGPPPPPPPGGPGFRASAPPPPPAQTSTAPMPMPGLPSRPPAPLAAPPAPGPGPSVMPPSQMTSRAMEQTALVSRAQQPESSRTGLIVGLVAGVAVVAGLAVFFLMPRTGAVAVNVTDAKGGPISRVSVSVDGAESPCHVAPCIIEKLPAGVRQVKVEADGYEVPAAKAVNVTSGQSVTVDFSLISGGKGGSGFKIAANLPGVKVFLDNKELGGLPQEVRDLAPGEHTLKLAGSDRYAVFEKKITVAKGEVQELTLPLKVLKGKATINLGTAGARVYLVSGSDRREFPTLPISVDLDPAKPWVLEATKVGFNDYRQTITFEDGQAEKSFSVTLDPKGTAAPTGGPATTVATTPTTPATTAAATTATKPAAAAGEAFVTLNSIPASNVALDGKPLGQTPKVKVSVSPGAHTIMFVNAEEGLKKSVTITVKAGETKPVILKLRE